MYFELEGIMFFVKQTKINTPLPKEMVELIFQIGVWLHPFFKEEDKKIFTEFKLETDYWEGGLWVLTWEWTNAFGGSELHPVFLYYHKPNAWGNSPATRVWVK